VQEQTTTLTITNDTACLAPVRDMVQRAIVEGHCPDEWGMQVQLAVDEAVTNIIEHAYSGVGRGLGTITLCQTIAVDRYQMIIEDNGLSFEPQTHGEIDIHEHVRRGRSGGLGIFLMRRIMDVVDYSFEAGVCNRLLLIKYMS
jgi:serine/threonine-protein kinase RsbW